MPSEKPTTNGESPVRISVTGLVSLDGTNYVALRSTKVTDKTTTYFILKQGDQWQGTVFRLLDFVPRVGELVNRFRSRTLEVRESLELARHALLLRYPTAEAAPVEPDTLLKARRPEDEGTDLWSSMNRISENLERGGVSDNHRDKRGKLRSVRALRGIDSRVNLSKGLWGLAEQLANGQPLDVPPW